MQRTRFASRLRRTATLVALAAAVLGSAVAAQRGQPNLRLRWAFGTVPKGSKALSSVRSGSVLKAGDKLKIYFRPATAMFVYVVSQDSEGTLETLFPIPGATAQASPDTEYYVPPGSEWLELDDHAGKEVFFLLVSSKPLTTLEAVLAEHARASASQRPVVGQRVLAEMQALRKRFFDEQTTAEMPGDIGGGTRGAADFKAISIDISARDFYSRTITIDHR